METEGREDISATLPFKAFFEVEPLSRKKLTGILFLGAVTDGHVTSGAELLATLSERDFFSPEPLGLPLKES